MSVCFDVNESDQQFVVYHLPFLFLLIFYMTWVPMRHFFTEFELFSLACPCNKTQ